MSRIKTLGLGLAFALSAADAGAQDSLLKDVAACVGRLSAQMEHFWLFDDKSSAEVETQRSHMIDVLEALTTKDNAHLALTHRIDAKLAHASLLTHAKFSTNAKTASWANAQSERQLRTCNSLILAAAPPAQPRRETAQDTSSSAKTVNQKAFRVSR